MTDKPMYAVVGRDQFVEQVRAAHVPSRPEEQRYAAHDLQALQEAMASAPFTLAELAAAIRRSPKSLAGVIKTAGR